MRDPSQAPGYRHANLAPMYIPDRPFAHFCSCTGCFAAWSAAFICASSPCVGSLWNSFREMSGQNSSNTPPIVPSAVTVKPVGNGLSETGVAGRVVQVGNGARDNIAGHIGVIRLPSPGIVVLTDYGSGDGVEQAMSLGPVAQSKVAFAAKLTH